MKYNLRKIVEDEETLAEICGCNGLKMEMGGNGIKWIKNQNKGETTRFSGICEGRPLMIADCHECTQTRSTPIAFVEPFIPKKSRKPAR